MSERNQKPDQRRPFARREEEAQARKEQAAPVKHLVLVILAFLGVATLVYYVLDGGTQPRCNSPEWTNVDGYR